MNKNLAVLAIMMLLGSGCTRQLPSKTKHTDNELPNAGTACSAEYNPVCGRALVNCIAAPCYDVPQTYSNACVANAAKAHMIVPGECPTDLRSDDPYVLEPYSAQVVTSPLKVKAQAPGTWFFEASLPVVLLDENKIILGTGVGTAEGDWMTTDFVPFHAEIAFKPGAATKGWVVIKKSNPSGLPQNERSFEIPVQF